MTNNDAARDSSRVKSDCIPCPGSETPDPLANVVPAARQIFDETCTILGEAQVGHILEILCITPDGEFYVHQSGPKAGGNDVPQSRVQAWQWITKNRESIPASYHVQGSQYAKVLDALGVQLPGKGKN